MRTVKDAVYGLAVGDAMGLPVQFEERGTYKVEGMTGDGTFNLPPGSWSDDSSLTLATCDSIRKWNKISVEDIRTRFLMWYTLGRYTPYGYAYDIGGTCGAAITSGQGQAEEWNCGNGSLMRIVPLAFLPDVTEEEIRQVSAVTHAHERCQTGCVYYVRMAQGLLAGRGLKELIQEIIPEDSEYSRIRGIEALPVEQIRSGGYIVDTFEAAVWCLLTTDSYKDCILKAVNLGEDTDTVGAVAGGLAGILYGFDAIPSEWVDALKAKEIIDSCLF